MTKAIPEIKAISITAQSSIFQLKDALATEALGAAIGRHAVKGDCILLRGELGAGKTTLTRGLINAIAQKEGADLVEVVSPTFPILQTYLLGQVEVFHMDLYRIEAETELFELGIEDALAQGLTVIEWPDIALSLLRQERLEVELAEHGGARRATLSGSLAAGSTEKWLKNE